MCYGSENSARLVFKGLEKIKYANNTRGISMILFGTSKETNTERTDMEPLVSD